MTGKFTQETDKELDPAELAITMEMLEDKIRNILKIAKEPMSMTLSTATIAKQTSQTHHHIQADAVG